MPIALQIIGIALFLWSLITTVGLADVLLNVDTVTDLLTSGAIALLCFAAARALEQLARIDERTARHTAALRRLLPPAAKSTHNDLAPHAPDWIEFKPRPVDPKREHDDTGYEQRLARRWRYTSRRS